MAGKPKNMKRDGVGKAIMQARLKAGLTQGELAKALGIYQTDVARYERTGRIHDPARFKLIAKILRTTPDHLLGLDQPPEYYVIKDGKMNKFVGMIDRGIVDLPDGEAERIAGELNDMIEKALKNSDSTQDKRKHPVSRHSD